MTDQAEIDAMLLDMVLECARPSWRFRLLFSARERQLLGFAINTFMGQRQSNLLLAELERRYGRYGYGANANPPPQAPINETIAEKNV